MADLTYQWQRARFRRAGSPREGWVRIGRPAYEPAEAAFDVLLGRDTLAAPDTYYETHWHLHGEPIKARAAVVELLPEFADDVVREAWETP